jgi:hypothetical protein
LVGYFYLVLNRGGGATAGVGAGEQVVLAADRNCRVILPMSGRRSRSIIAGMHSMGVAFDASMLSSAPAARSFMSRLRPAWSSWWRHGCSIPSPAPEWGLARRASRYRRWLSYITC